MHTYGTGGRLAVRDLAKQRRQAALDERGRGQLGQPAYNPTNIDNGLGIAARVMDDLRELEPKAWVLWQPVEDLYNMERRARS